MGSDRNYKDPNSSAKKLLGFGFWIQGFRCFPWMAVNFFLKDGIMVDPSTLQLLQNSANLPMVGKPLYGVVSDAVYIKGQHRVPYIAIGALLQAVSWIAIAILPTSKISIFTMSVYLLLSNLGASIVEVAHDAMVAESGKQPVNTSRGGASQTSSSSDLQSFVWMASSLGGILGNLLGGIAISRFSSQNMFLVFGLLLSLQFLITITVRESSLNLPKTTTNVGIKKQLLELGATLRKPKIAYSIGWFAASYAVIPALTGTMFFYQTQQLKINSSVLGISKVFGQVASLAWSILYNRRLKSVPPRHIISAIQATMAGLMLSDVLFVRGYYRTIGLPDSIYVIISSGLLEVLYFFKILPFNILMAQLCPAGCEGSLMAFVASSIALAFIVSGYFGVVLASFVGVSENDFSGFPMALMVQAACTVLPLAWAPWIASPPKAKSRTKSF